MLQVPTRTYGVQSLRLRHLPSRLNPQEIFTESFSVMKPETPRWEKWTLDAAFFDALAKWDKEHGESKIDRVIVKVCNAIDASDNYLKFIPDNPFPARGIVDALSQLIKLFAVCYHC